MTVRNLRKFVFESGNHIGTVEPPSSRLQAAVPAAKAGAKDTRVAMQEKPMAELEHDN